MTHARLSFCCFLWTAVAGAAEAQTPDHEALSLYKAGGDLFRAGKLREAIAKFEQAHARSNHPNNLYYLGEAHRRLGEHRRSYHHYTRYAASLEGTERAAFDAKLERMRFERPCRVTVATAPANATVMINDTARGRTGARGLSLELPGGRHLMRIELAGHRPVARAVVAEFGEPLAIAVRLERTGHAKATLSLEVPDGAARLLIDGRPAGTSPRTLELDPGDHAISIARDGYRPYRRRVRLEAGKRLLLDVQLAPSEPTADGRGSQRAKVLLGASIAASALAIGGLVGGVALNAKFNDEPAGSSSLDTYRAASVASYVAGGALAAVAALGWTVYAYGHGRR